jgi:uncharacterized protein with FMN-binding domain
MEADSVKTIAMTGAVCCLVALTAVAAQEQPARMPSLTEARSLLQVPPPWMAGVEIDYDTARPWKEARQEVRRLLAGGAEGRRQAVKLTYTYAQKNDIGDGHEYPMYLFMGGEYCWALVEYETFLAGKPEGHTHAYEALASCYRHFGEYEMALSTLNTAVSRLPESRWRIARRADLSDALGDLCAEAGDVRSARVHYARAVALYPTSDQPWSRELLAFQAAQVQRKVDMLDHGQISPAGLPDGTFTGVSRGYGGKELTVRLTLRDGRITDVSLDHEEKQDMDATTVIPQRILKAQTVKVDAVTGATVTSQAIVDAGFQALRTAGLRR